MKIAVIGWGSLIWDKEAKNIEFISKTWHDDGPELPIEFTRQSMDGRLTLVITPNVATVRTKWAEFDGTQSEIIEKLRKREGTTKEHIGTVERNSSQTVSVNRTIVSWLACHQSLQSAIWTNLVPKFDNKSHTISADDAVKYLQTLKSTEPEKFIKAREYICNSPIETSFRKRFFADVF